MASFHWCAGTMNADDQLMLLGSDRHERLVASARHGDPMAERRDAGDRHADESASTSAGRMSLAKQLRASVSATLATPFKGSAKPSVQLLTWSTSWRRELR